MQHGPDALVINHEKKTAHIMEMTRGRGNKEQGSQAGNWKLTRGGGHRALPQMDGDGNTVEDQEETEGNSEGDRNKKDEG